MNTNWLFLCFAQTFTARLRLLHHKAGIPRAAAACGGQIIAPELRVGSVSAACHDAMPPLGVSVAPDSFLSVCSHRVAPGGPVK